MISLNRRQRRGTIYLITAPDPKTGNWRIGREKNAELLDQFRHCEVVLIPAPMDGGEPTQLCGICGFALEKPGELCPGCALTNEDVAEAINAKRVADTATE